MILGWIKIDQDTFCAKTFTNRVVDICIFLQHLPNDVVLYDTINKCKCYLDKYGNIKILCMTVKLKFTEPEVEVHITRISYYTIPVIR